MASSLRLTFHTFSGKSPAVPRLHTAKAPKKQNKPERTDITLNSITIDRYLHAILALKRQYLVVRAVDVAAWLKCTKPSVSVAVKQMVQEGLISIGRHYALLLTEEGKRRACAFESRYDFFHHMLTEAGVNEDVAKKEAGALACSLSNPSLNAIKKAFPPSSSNAAGE